MPYFIILPIYVALLIGLISLGVILRFIPRFQRAGDYFIGAAVGSLIGFVIINIAVILLGVGPAWLAQKFTFPNWLQQSGKYFVAATLLIGPFIGSAIGVFLGFAAGIYYVFRKSRQTD